MFHMIALEQTFVNNSLQKIFLLLLPVRIGSRRVADNSESDERYVVEVAILRYGSRFHVYGQPLRKLGFYGIQFAALRDELVTSTNQPGMHGNR